MMSDHEPQLQERPEPGGRVSGTRLFVAAAAGLMLVAGGGAWLGNQTAPKPAAISDGGASGQPPAAQAAGNSGENHVAGTMMPVIAAQFALIAPDKAEAALKKAGYSAVDQERILRGIRRREYRLVHMPVFDAGMHGGVVSVQSGVMTKTIHLKATPEDVILPILISGEVRIVPVSDPGVGGITPGAVTVLGPTVLPIIHQDEYLTLDVVAQ